MSLANTENKDRRESGRTGSLQAAMPQPGNRPRAERSGAGGVAETLKAATGLCRPVNGIIAAAAVWMGAFIAGGDPVSLAVPLCFFSCATFLILAAGNTFNDLADIRIDAVNRPLRPLPSGRISPRQAGAAAALEAATGLAFGFAAGLIPGVISFFAGLSLVVYSIKLKIVPLAGNMLVAGLTGLTFISGGILAGNARGAAAPAVFAFFFTLAREIFKDIEDMPGDAAAGARTAPVVFGARRAWWTGAAAAIAGILYSPVPFLADGYSIVYLLIVLAGVDAVLIRSLFKHPPSTGPDGAGAVQRTLKLIILAGFTAILLGSPRGLP